jgi:hypothetical protein
LDVAVTLPPKTEQCGGELPLATETLDAAVQEALRAAHQVGIPVNEPCVLHNSRHVSIHLRPSKVVARVARIDATLSMQRIEREVAIARQLILRGAPIVGPVTRAPAGPFFSNGFGVTFWTYTEHVPADPENGAHVAGAADALRRMHAALAGYPAKLPPFMAKIEECGDVLMHPSALPALPFGGPELPPCRLPAGPPQIGDTADYRSPDPWGRRRPQRFHHTQRCTLRRL